MQASSEEHGLPCKRVVTTLVYSKTIDFCWGKWRLWASLVRLGDSARSAMCRQPEKAQIYAKTIVNQDIQGLFWKGHAVRQNHAASRMVNNQHR
jgi:hypothetical protein